MHRIGLPLPGRSTVKSGNTVFAGVWMPFGEARTSYLAMSADQGLTAALPADLQVHHVSLPTAAFSATEPQQQMVGIFSVC